MTRSAVSIGLKVPDNAAYTALVALRRLGVDVARVERSEIWLFDDDGDPETLRRRVMADETIFNPNLHRLTVLDEPVPRAGEVWIEPLTGCHPERSERSRRATRHAVAWRLYAAHDEPVNRAVLEAAIERLLCNPAIDRAVTNAGSIDRDIASATE
jgi:phosphoribosylformylglycinamidine (FGAM) synthase PurS component